MRQTEQEYDSDEHQSRAFDVDDSLIKVTDRPNISRELNRGITEDQAKCDLACRLWSWMKSNTKGLLSLHDIQRMGPIRVDKTETLELLTILEELDCVEQVEVKSAQGRAGVRWRLL